MKIQTQPKQDIQSMIQDIQKQQLIHPFVLLYKTMLHQKHCLGSTPTCFHKKKKFKSLLVFFDELPNFHEQIMLSGYAQPQGIYQVVSIYNDRPAFVKVSDLVDQRTTQPWHTEHMYFHKGTDIKVHWVIKCLSICFMFLVSMLVIMFVWSILYK